MTNSSPATVKISDQTSTGRKCCSGKKIVSYRCKVRCMTAVCILLVAAAGALLYFLLSKKSLSDPETLVSLPKKRNWFPQCPTTPLKPEDRFDCFPEKPDVDKPACESRGCCYVVPWSENETIPELMVPTCVYPRNYGYEATGKAKATLNGFEVPLQRMPAPSRYGDDVQLLLMRVEMQTKYRLRIKFYNPESVRYEVPSPKIPVHFSSQTSEQAAREVHLYSVTYNTVSSPFSVKVRRSSTDAVVFDTSVGALTFANQFLELTNKLPIATKVYGLEQYITKSFQHDFSREKMTLFNSMPEDRNSMSGSHPMYLGIENDGNSHGVLLLNSNAMEVQLHSSPAVTFRSIGGILDFYLFLGPSPEEVIQQYTEAVGRPMMPPYWALGFQIGKPIYSSVNDVEEFVKQFKAKHIPVEAFTFNLIVLQNYLSGVDEFVGFSDFASQLSSKDRKLLVNFEPKIPVDDVMQHDSIYNFGQQSDVLITDKWGLQPAIGMDNGKKVVYPDFGGTPATAWWTKVVNKIFSSIDIDGLWLVNNYPSSDTHGSVDNCLSDDLNRPPYVPNSFNSKILHHNTLCMDALLHWKEDVVTHYDYHNLYGFSSALATEQAFNVIDPQKRKLILSDSTFVGIGQYAGHFVKGIDCSWESLKSSIPTILKLAYYGIVFSGVNTCGDEIDFLEQNEELYLRWFQLSAFFPLMQVHGEISTYIHKSEAYSSEFSHAVRNAISRRYELLPYLYTLFFLAHSKGSTIMRPVFHEFPLDNFTYSITSQMLWGSSLLVSPVTEQGATELNFYLPAGIWYDFYQGISVYSDGEWFTERGGLFLDSKQPVVLHIRGGHIITLQKPSETITSSRQNSMSLLVALNSTYEASGFLYWDDGETKNSHTLGEYITVDFSANKTSVIINGKVGKKVFMSNFYRAVIQQVRIMGLRKPPKRIVIDGSYILSNKQYRWNLDNEVLDLKHILIPLERRTEIHWFF